MNFEEKVRAMSAKDIIMAMIDGLRNPKVQVSMITFGRYNAKKGICYGCAATNAICEISGVTFTDDRIMEVNSRADIIKTDVMFLDDLEFAYELLRTGDISEFNDKMNYMGLPKVVCPEDFNLPYLNDDYTEEELKIYEQLANIQN